MNLDLKIFIKISDVKIIINKRNMFNWKDIGFDFLQFGIIILDF